MRERLYKLDDKEYKLLLDLSKRYNVGGKHWKLQDNIITHDGEHYYNVDNVNDIWDGAEFAARQIAKEWEEKYKRVHNNIVNRCLGR